MLVGKADLVKSFINSIGYEKEPTTSMKKSREEFITTANIINNEDNAEYNYDEYNYENNYEFNNYETADWASETPDWTPEKETTEEETTEETPEKETTEDDADSQEMIVVDIGDNDPSEGLL